MLTLSSAKVSAANVCQQDELRGLKKDIRSFRALTKFAAVFAPQKVTEEIATRRKVSVEWVLARLAHGRLSPRAPEFV
jgi:hypothetical protein